jgi:hypothetical protein
MNTGESQLPSSEYTGESQLSGSEYIEKSRIPCDEYTSESFFGVLWTSTVQVYQKTFWWQTVQESRLPNVFITGESCLPDVFCPETRFLLFHRIKYSVRVIPSTSEESILLPGMKRNGIPRNTPMKFHEAANKSCLFRSFSLPQMIWNGIPTFFSSKMIQNGIPRVFLFQKWFFSSKNSSEQNSIGFFFSYEK